MGMEKINLTIRRCFVMEIQGQVKHILGIVETGPLWMEKGE